jgi:hypothetical protein
MTAPTASLVTQTRVTGEVIRASAALPAAGAYDTAGATFRANVSDRDTVSLWCEYTRGAASGGAAIKVYGSCDNGTTYALCAIVDPTSYSSGTQTLIGAIFKLPLATGASAEEWIVPNIDVSAFTHIQVLSAEYGITATPGTLQITIGTRRAVS